MKRHTLALIVMLGFTGPVMAAEANVNAQADVQAETEAGFFSRTWAGIKGFFGAGEDETTAAEPEDVEEDQSLIDKAAESTKAGVDWTADKAKKGAEWTKETAINVKDDAVGGAKAVGGAVKEGASNVGSAVKGVFSSDTSVEVEAEAETETQAN